MKKLLTVCTIAVLALALAACGGTQSAPSSASSAAAQTAASEPAAPDSSAGELDSYYVKINSASVGENYEGQPTLIVSCDFTNNSEENTSWMASILAQAFQNGVQLSTTVLSDNETTWTNIQPGTTYTVNEAFVLQDTTSPVDLEISSAFSFSDQKVTKTITLAQ